MERLDNEITMIMADAKNKLPEYPRFWWSDTLHNAHLVKEYQKAALSFEPNNTDGKLILEQRRNDVDPLVDVFKGNKNRKKQHNLGKPEGI
eukprot:14639258-Ditylum_brightwellii.AAC.2